MLTFLILFVTFVYVTSKIVLLSIEAVIVLLWLLCFDNFMILLHTCLWINYKVIYIQINKKAATFWDSKI